MLFPALERRLTGLASGRDLTWSVGLLAVLLTLLLGAGHAALPGHAKLAVAACLARREGGVRAALTVGTTVTATHTAGVLAMGLILFCGHQPHTAEPSHPLNRSSRPPARPGSHVHGGVSRCSVQMVLPRSV
ncbi:hypothetical protein RB201_21395 [Streptomyces sp. S1A(2023)]